MLPPLLFCTSSSFSFLSLPLLLLHVLFLSWSDGSSGVKRRWSSTGHAMFLSSILSFSMTERERERDRPRTSASRSTFLSSLRVRFSSSSRFRVLSLRLFVKNRSRVYIGVCRLDSEGSTERRQGRIESQREEDCIPSGIATRRHSAYPRNALRNRSIQRRDRIFACSTVHAILEPRTQNLVVLHTWNDGYLPVITILPIAIHDRPVSLDFVSPTNHS